MKYNNIIPFLFIITITYSFEKMNIYGTVTNNRNLPINNVVISSDDDFVYTDNYGNFNLYYKNINDKITFTRIGYKEKIMTIEDILSNSTILLEKKALNLNDVEISTLYGKTKKFNSVQDVQVVTNRNINIGDNHFEDIINKIPNFSVAGGTSRPRFFQIRGIGERSQYAGEGGPIYYIGTVIDDIDLSGIGMPIFLDDIKQIEIYQGPQSYAYGSNAMAGLIKINTIEPSNEKRNNLKITLGNDNLYKFSNSMTLPISNKLFINSFFYYSSSDGFIYNTYLKDYKNNKIEVVEKIKLLFKPSKSFKSKSTFIYSNLNNGYDIWSPNNNGDTSYSNNPGKDSQQLLAWSMKNEYKLKKNKLTHILNFLKSNMKHSYDSDWGNDDFWLNDPYNVNGWSYEYFQNELRERSMISHEFRLNSKIFSTIRNTFGIYYKNLLEDDKATGWIFGGEDAGLISQFNIKNYALFNETILSTNKYTLTLNTRFEKFDLKYKSTHFHEILDDYTYITTYDTSYVDINNKNNDALIGGKVSLLYKVNNNNNIFLTISNGFKSGGVNQNPRLAEINRTYKPEFNRNIDFGYRAIRDNSSLNITAFYMQRENLQVSLSSQQDNDNPNSFYFYTTNASKGYNYGLNLDYNQDRENFKSFFAIGLLETKINSYSYLEDEFTLTDFNERRSAHAPSYTFSMGFTKYYQSYNFGINMQGKDKFYFSDSHNEESYSYSIANIFLGYELSSKTEFLIWGKNIFNKRYATRGFFFGLEPPSYNNKLYKVYGEPFTIGLTINHKIL